MTPGRIWRRTAVDRNGRLVPLPDDWSLMDPASGLAIARIHTEPDGGWRCVCRSSVEGALKDSIMAWFKTGKTKHVLTQLETAWFLKEGRTRWRFWRNRPSIAVGTLIAERPPHRSGLAQFRHPAPVDGV